jgi:hypothetical protein
MPIVLVDSQVRPALDAILAAMRVQLGQVTSPPAHYRIVPGTANVIAIKEEAAIGWLDECCEGVAWVRMVSKYPTSTFPEHELWYPEHPTSWAVVLELGSARCGGGPGLVMAPTDDQYGADEQAMLDDLAALIRVPSSIAYPEMHGILDFVFGAGDPMVSEGNCMATTLGLTIQQPYCLPL